MIVIHRLSGALCYRPCSFLQGRLVPSYTIGLGHKPACLLVRGGAAGLMRGRRSARPPPTCTPRSLISAVGIFCLGAGVSIVHGIHAIVDPAIHVGSGWALAVLTMSTVVEGYTLLVAVRAVAAGAAAARMSFGAFVKSGAPHLV